jgi:chromate transporter
MNTSDEHVEVSLRDLFRVFAIIGISSFGGGLSGWMYREIVERRGWISGHEFLVGLSLARAMPGTNMVNQSIWIGYRLRKSVGAIVAVCSVLAAPLFLIILFAYLYQRWGHSTQLHQVLLGVAAVGLGFSFSMSLKSLRFAAGTPFFALIVVLTFVGVGLFHWPTLAIVSALAPVSIGWAFFMDQANEN